MLCRKVSTGVKIKVISRSRKCQLCNSVLGDEYHYILECKHFSQDRKKLIKEYYYKHSNILKFKQLFNTEIKNELINLCKFLNIIKKSVTAVYN